MKRENLVYYNFLRENGHYYIFKIPKKFRKIDKIDINKEYNKLYRRFDNANFIWRYLYYPYRNIGSKKPKSFNEKYKNLSKTMY